MPLETLEALRLLTNLETEKRKLLHVVLFGQPELDRKLAIKSIRQLRQRITFQHSLKGLLEDEVGAYVAHRLAVAGYRGAPLFAPRAVAALHRASTGVPRLVNILAHKSLLAVFGQGVRHVERVHVRNAVADTPSAAPLGRWWWPRLRLTRAAD
jgi:MSHA biogenesis protein MshM